MRPSPTPTLVDGRVVIYTHASSADPGQDLSDIRDSLLHSPRELPSRFFYDERGGELFDRICDLPEYYPYRAEREILTREARRIVDSTGASILVELGSGASTKTRLLLDAMSDAGSLRRYVPMDVNESLVHRVAEELVDRYEHLDVEGHIGDFLTGLDHLPLGEGRLVIFLGGTIGNFSRVEAESFLRRIAGRLDPGDCFLLGTDLVKDVARLEAAYNDSQGVTAEFNKNILGVVNDLTASDFDPGVFEHRAFYDGDRSWIEMRLRATRPADVRLPRLGMEIHLPAGEEIRTEISMKYTRESVESLLNQAGFELIQMLTDREKLFALSLARRTLVV